VMLKYHVPDGRPVSLTVTVYIISEKDTVSERAVPFIVKVEDDGLGL